MLRVGLIGLGKMGISHCAILGAHPGVELAAVCEPSGYVRDVIGKYTGLTTYSDYRQMLKKGGLDAVVVAVPSSLHGEVVGRALEHNLHVFCEKPFCLDLEEGRKLVALAEAKKLVTQVGYHYRFVGSFRKAKELIETGVIGTPHYIRAEAYGGVVLRPQGTTWRVKKSEGGGCLYDYACHAIDLVNYLVGPPSGVSGAVLNTLFSEDVEDEVYATMTFPGGMNGQLAANWSDESHRKMSTKIGVWGSKGRIVAERQEIQIFMRDDSAEAQGLPKGWTILYATELCDEVEYYLRGEEYSEQIDYFVCCVNEGKRDNVSNFASALQTDVVVDMIVKNAQRSRNTLGGARA